MMSRIARALTGALCFSLAVTTARSQEAAPLHKGDLVRFLSGTTYSKPEIAAIIRRACLAFSPTTRDNENLKELGATPAVLNAMKTCTANGNKVARAEIATPAPIRPMEVDLPSRGLSATAGTVALFTVTIHRGPTPLSGVRLLLHGSREIPGGAHAELNANTDRDGRATFSIPAGSTAGNYNLRIADADGVEMHGVTDFVLTTLPSAPALVKVTPQTLDIGASARGTRDVIVTVSDPFGNPAPRLPVMLRQFPVRGTAITPTQLTDNAGIAHFAVQAAPLHDGDSLVVSIADRPYATVHVTAAAEITTLLLDAERQLSEGNVAAEGAYDSVLSVDPSNARALIGRGYILSSQGKAEPATQDFTAAMKENDERASALTGLGYLALRRGDLSTAAARFSEALAIDSSDAGAATGLAYAELWRIDPRQLPHRAAALASPRPTAYPADAAHQLRAGIDFFAARNLKSAERSLSSAASAAPSWPDAYYTRALVYQADGQSSLAVADFQHYLQLRPSAVDRVAVTSRIDALNRSPGKALALGIIPGGGQFYTHQPVLGLVVLGGVAASAVWALKSSPIIFTDPFGHPYQAGTTRKNLTTGLAVGGGLWVIGALEAAL
ncbi:MAG TPA: tetratricopeptide repeat protein, partial [Gemmatimonadaceae bacterium]